MTAVDVAAGGALAGRRAVFRSCPFTGLKVDLAAQRLIAANAVAAVIFLAVGGLYDPGRAYACADWATLARAQARGLRIGVLQWPAVRYRRNTARSGLVAQKLDQEGARAMVFAAYEGAFDAELVGRYAQMLNLEVT